MHSYRISVQCWTDFRLFSRFHKNALYESGATDSHLGGPQLTIPHPENPTIGNTSSKNTYFPDGYYGRPLATETHRKRLICIFSHIQSQPVCMCMGMVFGPVQNIHFQSLKRTHSLSNIFSGAIFPENKIQNSNSEFCTDNVNYPE